MKKIYMLIVAVLAIITIQSSLFRVVGVANIKNHVSVFGVADCHYKINVQYTHLADNKLNVVLVANRVRGRVCEGEKSFTVTLPDRAYKIVCINGKCWEVR